MKKTLILLATITSVIPASPEEEFFVYDNRTPLQSVYHYEEPVYAPNYIWKDALRDAYDLDESLDAKRVNVPLFKENVIDDDFEIVDHEDKRIKVGNSYISLKKTVVVPETQEIEITKITALTTAVFIGAQLVKLGYDYFTSNRNTFSTLLSRTLLGLFR
jgi:hypothetical protein